MEQKKERDYFSWIMGGVIIVFLAIMFSLMLASEKRKTKLLAEMQKEQMVTTGYSNVTRAMILADGNVVDVTIDYVYTINLLDFDQMKKLFLKRSVLEHSLDSFVMNEFFVELATLKTNNVKKAIKKNEMEKKINHSANKVIRVDITLRNIDIKETQAK